MTARSILSGQWGQSITSIHPRTLVSCAVGVAIISYVIGVVIYRLYFHPLAKFPGPFFAKITNIYDFLQALSEHRAENFLALHDKYGPVVRYAPDCLSFNEPQTFQGNGAFKEHILIAPRSLTLQADIYGYKANVRKADSIVAAQSNPEVTDTFSELYKEAALKKRKVLSQGFSENSLRSVEGYVLDQINIFCRQLVNPSTERVKDMAKWMSYLAYDCMGEIVFGKGFGMLTDPSLRYILELMDMTVYSYLLGGCLPLLHKTGLMTLLLPKIFFMRKKFVAESTRRIKERMARGADAVGPNQRKDFFFHLMNARDADTGRPLSEAEIGAEGALLILAGSDTTSAAMAACLFYLMQQTKCQEKLYNELSATFSSVDEIKTGETLNSCVYLRACAAEAVRLAPALPGLSPRTILKGGAVICGQHFPEGVTVGISGWATAYSSKYVVDPYTFMPERHIPGERFSNVQIQELHDSYWPFSLGPRKCPGMKVAYLELQLTIARLVYLFEITPERPEELQKNYVLLDHLNPKKVGPYASFKLRPGKSLPETKPVEV